jgi:hypothetical protein
MAVAAVVVAAITAFAVAATVSPASAARSAAVGAGSGSAPLEPSQQLHLPAKISELPVPPTVPANGACTSPAGCVSGAWGALGSPGFYWDASYVLLGVTYAGAPAAGPASIYSGPQVVLEKTDGTTFPGGEAWKCLTCGVTLPAGVLQSDFTYPPPRALPGDKQVLVGNAILDCTGPIGELLTLSDRRCTSGDTHLYPIYLKGTPLGARSAAAPFGNGREWRLSPDGVHLAWDSLELSGASVSEDEFEGTLALDPAGQRYNLTEMYYLPQAPDWAVKGSQLVFKPQAMIGELRGWSSDGKSVLGIQSYESDSIDAWSTSLATGRSVPLTVHAEYTDPMFMSPNGKWLAADEANGSGRLDFISGVQGIAPVTDLLTTAAVSEIRNAGSRRYFEPWVVSPAQGRAEQVNAASADPDWNAAADPDWLADSTAIVWAENYACGANPSPHQCAGSVEPGGRNSRIMIARFPLPPSKATPPAPIPDNLAASWAIPYTGQALSAPSAVIPSGTYTVGGERGYATVVITDNNAGTAIDEVQAAFHDYVQNRANVINGTESVDASVPGFLTWHDDLTSRGAQDGSKVTSPDGFTVNLLDELRANDFEVTGTLTTTINGTTYTQPSNGA